MKKILNSTRRILLLLGILLGVPTAVYCLWSPGESFAKSNRDRQENAIWIGHGWLGDDAWFKHNQRNVDDFRNDTKIHNLLQNLKNNHIKFVYPHLCPAQYNGRIAEYDSIQVENFLNIAESYGIMVIPWIGGVFEESARPADELWRKNFAISIAELLAKHPRIGGVQINIEPMPSGNLDFLTLLDEIRPLLTDKILGVAAYPPPTKWHPFPNVHWELPYLKKVAQRSDQMAVMMYDTAIRFDKFYIKLMRDWADELNDAVSDTTCKLMLGIPSYEDANVGYHFPDVENIENALRGIQASKIAPNYQGIAIYCEWEMTPQKWKLWRNFLRQK